MTLHEYNVNLFQCLTTTNTSLLEGRGIIYKNILCYDKARNINKLMEVHLRSFGVKYQMTTATTELEADTKNIDFIQKKPEM